MDTLLAAVVAGAIAASGEVAGTAIKDAYQALKKMILDKFKVDLAMVEKDPKSQSRREVVSDDLLSAGADKDGDTLAAAANLLELLADAEEGGSLSQTIIASLEGEQISLRRIATGANILVVKDLKATGSIEIEDIDHSPTGQKKTTKAGH